MVEYLAWDQVLALSFPQDGVEIGEVVVDVYPVVAPSPQRPAAELRTLRTKRAG